MTAFRVEDYIERVKEPAPGVTNQKWASRAFSASMTGLGLTLMLFVAVFLNESWAPALKTPMLWTYALARGLLGVAMLIFALGFMHDLGQFPRLLARQIDERSLRLRALAAEFASLMSQHELELALRDIRFDIQLRERLKARALLLGAIGGGLVAVVGGLPGGPVTLSLSETLAYGVPAAVLGASMGLGYIHSFIDRLTCMAYAIEEAARSLGQPEAQTAVPVPPLSAKRAA